MQLFSWYLFVAAHACLALCCVGLLRLQARTKYRAFLTYVVFQLVQFATTFSLDKLLPRSAASLVTYRWVSVAGDAVSTILTLIVLYELADQLVLSRSTLIRPLRSVLRWSGAVLILIAAAVSGVIAHPGIARVTNIFATLTFSSNLIMLGLLLVLLIFSRALQVPWRSLPAGIALGFGINASAEMAASFLMSSFGSPRYLTMDLIRMAALLGCVVVWTVYVFLPERVVASPGLQRHVLEFWDQEMQRMVHR